MSDTAKNRKFTMAAIVGSVAVAGAGLVFQMGGDKPIDPEHPATAATVKPAARHPSFLFLSDVHLDSEADSTQYGGDTGKGLWAAFLAKVSSILGGPDSPGFIVYTGDLPAHYSCSDGYYLPPDKRQEHEANLKAILSGLHKMAEQYHKPIFYLPGNNDALAGDYYSFADEKQNTPLGLVASTPYFFPDSPGVTGTLQPPCIVSDPFPKLGFYAASPVKGLRLIAMNTVIYNWQFKTVDGTQQLADGNAQMTFLANQLADAEAKREKVYIAMHIPPGVDAHSGNDMWVNLSSGKNSWLNNFLNLTDRYQSTIAGILYGHTHMDELRRLYDSTGTHITEVAISCPGVTPQHNNNPGFKTVQYDPISMELIDFTTYYTYPNRVQWGDSTYTFSGIYGGGASIFTRVSTLPFASVVQFVGETFKVKNGSPGSGYVRGIEVKQGR
jgi:sphingomyelin phosphodiesterase acid-like 3